MYKNIYMTKQLYINIHSLTYQPATKEMIMIIKTNEDILLLFYTFLIYSMICFILLCFLIPLYVHLFIKEMYQIISVFIS